MSDVRSLVVDGMRRYGMVGGAVAVVRPGQPPELECIGCADPSSGRAVAPDTVFRIASISKTMTAIAIMQLRDEGRLELDEPVNRYLKSFTVEPPLGGAPVTIRHLLTHTSGIGELPRLGALLSRRQFGIGPPGSDPVVLSDIYRGTLRPEVAAGTKWAYANHAFATLGQVVEDLTGEPFAQHMQARLFGPLRMGSTSYLRNDDLAARLATGSHWILGRLRTVKDYELTFLGPGSVLSSLADMARYAEWLISGGATAPDVLRAETLHEMMSPQFSVHPGFPGMGLAFWLAQLGDHRAVGHDGNVPGFGSSLLVAPDAGVGVVVLNNTATAIGSHVIALEVLRSLLQVTSPAEARGAAAVPERPEVWDGLVGHYAPAPGLLTNARSWQMAGGEVQVIVRDRRLVLRSLSVVPQLRKGVALHAADPDDPLLFVAEASGLTVPVAFTPNSSGGPATSVTIGPPSNTVFHRRSTLRSLRVRQRLAATAAAAVVARRLWRRLSPR
ncbi:MAG: beta-lactamase family protein [Actinobacteria bacterium]|nr:beta-lactamase family protein [Actinomycetota bacterium]